MVVGTQLTTASAFVPASDGLAESVAASVVPPPPPEEELQAATNTPPARTTTTSPETTIVVLTARDSSRKQRGRRLIPLTSSATTRDAPERRCYVPLRTTRSDGPRCARTPLLRVSYAVRRAPWSRSPSHWRRRPR